MISIYIINYLFMYVCVWGLVSGWGGGSGMGYSRIFFVGHLGTDSASAGVEGDVEAGFVGRFHRVGVYESGGCGGWIVG